MAHRDLRAFLDDLESRGDLLRVRRSVDPRLTASAVLRLLDREEGPAVLFERLRGHKVPVVGNLLSARRRLAAALDSKADFKADLASRLEKRIKTKSVRNPPVQEVVLRKGIDLKTLLPVLTYHQRDAGPYITSGVLLYRNPETDRIHLGIYRMQIRTGNTLTVQVLSPPLVRFMAEADVRGEAIPIAVCLGPDPGLYLGSVLQTEPGHDRLEQVGGLRGAAVEIADGVSVDLPVPARAEIILEGRLLPRKRVPEGPMGESSGVYTENQSCLAEITTVSHRKNPLYHALLPWSRDEESLLALAYALPMELRLRARDPGVVALHLVPGTSSTHAVIAIRKNRRGHARDVLTLAFGLFPLLKHIVVVDDDIDPEDGRMVAWAQATRFQGDRDLILIPKGSGFAIDPSARRRDGALLTTKIGLDATIPASDPARFERIDVGERAREKAARILQNPS